MKNRKRMAQVATVYTLASWQRTAADDLAEPAEQHEVAVTREA